MIAVTSSSPRKVLPHDLPPTPEAFARNCQEADRVDALKDLYCPGWRTREEPE
jgi:hypothetical protein